MRVQRAFCETLILALSVLLVSGSSRAATKIGVENVSNYAGNSTWGWTIFLTGPRDSLASVVYVEYTLHPSFANPVQKVERTSDPRQPFGFTTPGWGVFPVGVRVVYKNGQVDHLTHLLHFEQAPQGTKCLKAFNLVNRHPKRLDDPPFNGQVYAYVDEIHTEWKKNSPTLTLLYGSLPSLQVDQYLSASKFATQTKGISAETRWSLKIQHEQDALQFRYSGLYYLLTVTDVAVHRGEDNYLALQICERQ